VTLHKTAVIDGRRMFYREEGRADAPALVLLHGFPSSSHMFRDLIPLLADRFRVIAPDFIGFGYSDRPAASEFAYNFENLTAHVEKLLFEALGLTKFAIYVQDYGAPVGFRIASRHPEAITGIVVQNGNAYAEGLSAGWAPLRALWADRNAETEKAARGMLTAETTRFQYIHGVGNPEAVSPDAWTFDQRVLDLPGSDAIQLDLFHDYASNLALYDEWQAYFRAYRPPTLIVWGRNDPFFTVEGAKAFLNDLPEAELHLLDTGHFALEEQSAFIAEKIRAFFGRRPTALKPPFNAETARLKVQAAEDAWNTRNPDRVAMAYTEDSEWRNRTEFPRGRGEIKAFLTRKWAKELDYRLRKTLWCWTDDRIAVTFEYEWHDETGAWFRSYGNELWEFDADGLMKRRIASINDAPIEESKRRIR
jgi:nuclear transport factor 2 (NTF2) superfamily protein/pimeloyl-ACP methyl ester carboxylesterase